MAFPSTFLDLQNAVIAKASLDATADLQRVKDWLNQVYTHVCVETEANATSATMNLTAGSASYTLPAAVARIKSMYLVPAGQPATVGEQPPMTRTTFDDIELKRQSGGLLQQAGSYSTHYALQGISALDFWPTPAAVDVVTINYAAFPTPLSSNTDVPILEEPYASRVLEYGALIHAGEFKGDPQTPKWEASFGEWMGRYLHHLDVKQGDMPGTFHQWGSPNLPELSRGW